MGRIMERSGERGMMDARAWARTGVLAAFALVLSYAETFVPLPVPVPGAKIGLANIPIIMALVLLDGKSAFAIALIKTLVTGLLFGSPLMIPYSAAGTFLALGVMAVLVRVPGLHLTLVSMIGSIFHIVGQLAVATLLLGTPLVWYTFPLLLVIACFTGAVTGWAAHRLVGVLAAVPLEAEEKAVASSSQEEGSAERPLRTFGRAFAPSPLSRLFEHVDARWILAGFVVYVVVTLCVRGPVGMGACIAVALLVAAGARVGAGDALRALVPLLSILVVTAIAQVLYEQQGTVVLTLGPLSVTDLALATMAFMFLRLLCLMAVSIALVRAVSFERISQALLQLLSPLSRLGVRADGLALAFDVALQFVPLLMDDFERLRAERTSADPAFATGGLFAKLRSYSSLIGPLAVRAFASADEVAEGFAQRESAVEGSTACDRANSTVLASRLLRDS